MSADDGPGTREVARRIFAAEYEDGTLSYSESDEERAPNYVVTPTGARINRLFIVGVLTETERVNEDMVRARIVDPTGAFVAYAGQYQPDELAFLERTDPPAFVALTGKARTFQPEDSDRVYTSIRPESVNAVDADTRDRWTVSAAEATLRRVRLLADALESDLRGEELTAHLREEGVDESLAAGIPRAIDHYGTTTAYLEAVRQQAVDALEVVAGEREEVRPLSVAPDEGGAADLGPVPDEVAVEATAVAATTETESTAEAASEEPTVESDVEATTDADAESGVEAETDMELTSDVNAASDVESAGEEPGEEPVAPDPDVTVESSAAETAPTSDPEELGDFETETTGQQESEESASGFDSDEMYEFDEEERQEVEEEFGVEFESGSEVGEPGEADIEPPSEESPAETTEPEPTAPESETVTGADSAPTAEEAEADGDESSESDAGESAVSETDLEAAAIEAMDELDDGDGAPREEVVAVVVDQYGADPGTVEDAIQEALMDGRCYEPGEDRLKAI